MIDPSEPHEVIDVIITKVRLQGIEDVGDGDAQSLRPLPIDMGIQPRGGHSKIRSHSADGRFFLRPFDELLRDRCEFLEIPSGGILQLRREPSDRTDTPNRRRIEGEQQSFRNLRKLSVGGTDKRLRVILRILPLIPEHERHEHGGRIRPPSAKDKILSG